MPKLRVIDCAAARNRYIEKTNHEIRMNVLSVKWMSLIVSVWALVVIGCIAFTDIENPILLMPLAYLLFSLLITAVLSRKSIERITDQDKEFGVVR